MAVINDPNTAANITAVGSKNFSPLHSISGPYPVGAGGAYRINMVSGTISASLAANSELFQFRYVTAASRVCIVHGVTVSAAMIVAPAVSTTTPVNMQLVGKIARSFSANGSGGTSATMTTNNQKMKTSQATSEVADIRVASTTGLGAGTKTFDSQAFGGITGGVFFGLAAGDIDATLIRQTNLLGDFYSPLGFPLELANNEGFCILSGIAMPATLTWNLSVNTWWTEQDSTI